MWKAGRPPRPSWPKAALCFSSLSELVWEETKRGLTTETNSRFISASFLVFIEKKADDELLTRISQASFYYVQ